MIVLPFIVVCITQQILAVWWWIQGYLVACDTSCVAEP